MLSLLIVIALWGSNIPLAKWLTTQFDVVLQTSVRMVTAAAVMALLLRRGGPRPKLTRQQVAQLFVCGVLMVYLNQLLFVGGVARSSATHGSLITATNPLAASLMALWFLGERMTWRRMAGIALGLGGVGLVVLMRPGAQMAEGGIGDLMMVLAIVTFAAGAVIVQRLATQLDAVAISVGIHVAGASCLVLQLGLEAAWRGQWPKASSSVQMWLVLALSGALATGIGNLLWNRAIVAVGMARAFVWLYWLPLFGVAMSVVFLGEPLTPWLVIGLLLVLAGTRLGSR